MTVLHAYFALRNQQAFQRLLDGTTGPKPSPMASSDGGRSRNRSTALHTAMSCDINAKDWLGRTVLHLACSAVDAGSLTYVKMLLAHPAINVNVCDAESNWTALHRALYNGNIPATLLLLQRSDTDLHTKDPEGYTAFDLYNSTIEGTLLPRYDFDKVNGGELYTWGTNRNACLAQEDGDDRLHPDLVTIQRSDAPGSQLENLPVDARLLPIRVKDVQIAKLHTAVITAEAIGNLRMCGFGSGGRLGPGRHAQQYALKPIPNLNLTITSVALGQDHTLALTSNGEIFSWGLNRFSQLGYIIERVSSTGISEFSRKDEPAQSVPRKVAGPLKKEVVIGVAACKTASACWTAKQVYTWGTNHGQLGYDKAANPVQILPKIVTKVAESVSGIALSDNAMACLIRRHERPDIFTVACIYNDTYIRVNFSQPFPAGIAPYRVTADVHIVKVISCDDTFAALSSSGEVYTFRFPLDGLSGRASVKPQRVWSHRQQFTSVRDICLGSNGSIIVCTESGHVLVGSRSATKQKSGPQSQQRHNKPLKFTYVPFLQRVVKVGANSTGAFSALRIDYAPTPIIISGNKVENDLRKVMPWLNPLVSIYPSNRFQLHHTVPSDEHAHEFTFGKEHEGNDDDDLQDAIRELDKLLRLLIESKHDIPDTFWQCPAIHLHHGADMLVRGKRPGAPGVFHIPAHRVILAARSSVLCQILTDAAIIQSQDSHITISLVKQDKNQGSTLFTTLAFSGCHMLSVLILIVYLYTDSLLAIWDRRLAAFFEPQVKQLKAEPSMVKSELQLLSALLELPYLSRALDSPGQQDPVSSLKRDLKDMYDKAQCLTVDTSVTSCLSPLFPDVVLQLSDKEVYCHSTMLRARSVFFSNFFDEEAWTVKRWEKSKTLVIHFKHLEWRSMRYVLEFMCCGSDEEMLIHLEHLGSVDEVLELMFSILAAANELLIDRLVLLCSSVILKLASVSNCCAILTDATHYHVPALIECIQEYMTVTMETLLEDRLLDVLTPTLVKQLSEFVCRKQAQKYPVSRSGRLVQPLLEKHKEWLSQQDMPLPIPVHSGSGILRRASMKVSPSAVVSMPRKETPRAVTALDVPPPPRHRHTSSEDIFVMDVAHVDTQPHTDSVRPAVWKTTSAPRVAMKTLLAEAQIESQPGPSAPPRSYDVLATKFGQRAQREYETSSQTTSSTSTLQAWSRSPWRAQVDKSGVVPTPSSIPSHTPAKRTGGSLFESPSASKYQTESGFSVSGPVFTPARQTSSYPTSSNAWTSLLHQPTTHSSPGVSLVAIQQLQMEQSTILSKEKHSLRDIQEEERDRQIEKDFLKWWTAEEERVKQEMQSLSQFKKQAKTRKDSKPSKKSRP